MTKIPPVREPVLLSSVIAVPDIIQLIEIAGPLAAVIVPELLSVPRAGLLIIPFRRIWPRMLPVLVSVLSVRLLYRSPTMDPLFVKVPIVPLLLIDPVKVPLLFNTLIVPLLLAIELLVPVICDVLVKLVITPALLKYPYGPPLTVPLLMKVLAAP